MYVATKEYDWSNIHVNEDHYPCGSCQLTRSIYKLDTVTTDSRCTLGSLHADSSTAGYPGLQRSTLGFRVLPCACNAEHNTLLPCSERVPHATQLRSLCPIYSASLSWNECAWQAVSPAPILCLSQVVMCAGCHILSPCSPPRLDMQSYVRGRAEEIIPRCLLQREMKQGNTAGINPLTPTSTSMGTQWQQQPQRLRTQRP